MPHIMPRMSDERPWVVSYPSDVPRSIAPFPSESVFGLLESAAGRFPDRPAIAWFGKHLSYKQLLREVEPASLAGALMQREQTLSHAPVVLQNTDGCTDSAIT